LDGVRRAVAVACLLVLGACAGVTDESAQLPGDDRAVPGKPGASGMAADASAGAQPGGRPATADPATKDEVSVPERRPNIVLVLMDDFSMDLVPSLGSAREMARRGADYRHAYVVDSLCCVSRASLLTGQYPHQTGVRTNTAGVLTGAPLGGWAAFEGYGNQERSVNVALQEAGYATGFVGKYLNEYEWTPGREVPPLPPGWSQFHAVFGSGYDGWDFASTSVAQGVLQLEQHDAPPMDAPVEERDAAYQGAVISDLALDFIRTHADGESPYFLEVAPYGPHNRTNTEPHYPGDPLFPPAFRDRPSAERPTGDCGPVPCPSLTTEDLPGFGDDRGDNVPRRRDGTPTRAWNTTEPPWEPATYERDLRNRARMVQSIDRMVRDILRAVDDDTYVVLTSDNGFHLGQLGLGRGKGTPYATDVHVPLYVVGPGVVPGTRDQMTSNLDLAPTFEDLAGLSPRDFRSGRSIARSFEEPEAGDRNYVFHEHTAQVLTGGDPDRAFSGSELDRIPSYVAVRSRDALLVRHDLEPAVADDPPAYEFYSYADDSWERTNTLTAPRHRAEVDRLLERLAEFDDCAAVTGDDEVGPRCRRITS
jgi:N-acetylglucosamine-6-sulfatase